MSQSTNARLSVHFGSLSTNSPLLHVSKFAWITLEFCRPSCPRKNPNFRSCAPGTIRCNSRVLTIRTTDSFSVFVHELCFALLLLCVVLAVVRSISVFPLGSSRAYLGVAPSSHEVFAWVYVKISVTYRIGICDIVRLFFRGSW